MTGRQALHDLQVQLDVSVPNIWDRERLAQCIDQLIKARIREALEVRNENEKGSPTG